MLLIGINQVNQVNHLFLWAISHGILIGKPVNHLFRLGPSKSHGYVSHNRRDPHRFGGGEAIPHWPRHGRTRWGTLVGPVVILLGKKKVPRCSKYTHGFSNLFCVSDCLSDFPDRLRQCLGAIWAQYL